MNSQSKSKSKSKSNNSTIKQFSKSNDNSLWEKMDNSKVTLKDTTKDLYLENDIIIKGTIQNPSDINLKTNIESISEEESNNLSNLLPVKYEYIGDTMKREHYGLIAQDVEKIYPNLVREDLFYNYKSVNYVELIPILINKINHLEKEIEKLKH